MFLLANAPVSGRSCACKINSDITVMLSSIGKKVKGSRAKESLIEAEDRKLEDICPAGLYVLNFDLR
jgi:hypothetical protein